MMTTTNYFLRKTYAPITFPDGSFEYMRPRNKAVCADGFTISIQASDSHYCEPRKLFEGPYQSVELGFPSDFDELIDEYAEDSGKLNTVFGWVPVEVVDELVAKHGGIVYQPDEVK